MSSITNYTLTYNGYTAKSKGLEISYRPPIPSAVDKMTEYVIPKRDGKLHYYEGTVEDIDISVTFSFVATEDTFGTTFREIMAWLYDDTDRTLSFSDDADWYYKVKRVTVGTDVERIHKIAGAFKVTFTCEGYAYKKSGQNPTSNYTNSYDTSHPLYEISGSGQCTLTVNGMTMTASVVSKIYIDTDLMIAYRSGGTMANTSVTGDYSDLWLKPGSNSVSVTNGFTLVTRPRWRCRT